MRLLLIKTSSIGDILHAFPAVTDAAKAIPGLTIDWVVEKDLVSIPPLHRAVHRVIAVSYREWRKRPLAGLLGGHLRRFRDRVAKEQYDRVLDTQGLYKSAVIARLARGERHGFDFASAREGVATLAYKVTHGVPKDRHAIERQRQLMAAALGYALPVTPPDYGIDRARLPPPSDDRYLVFLHGTAWHTKLWPESHWQHLARLASAAGYRVQLPYFSVTDRARADRIAAAAEGAAAVSTPTLEDACALVAGASGAAAVDTGLGHFAAALDIPTVSIYGPTSPSLTGTVGARQCRIASTLPCAPCRSRVCRISSDQALPPPCLLELTPAQAWQALSQVLPVPAAP